MVPSALDQAKQEELKAAVQQSPTASGLELVNWYWKAVRQFVLESFGISLSRSSCLNWLHRSGFAFKRPKKRLLKADEGKRAAFVAARLLTTPVASRMWLVAWAKAAR